MANLMVPPQKFSANSDQASLFPTGTLGRLFEDDNGKVYKSIHAKAGALAAQDCVQLDVSEGNSYSVEQCAANGRAIGVCETAISSGNYGFIVVGGVATCKTGANSGASTAGAIVIPAASAGRVDTSGSATNSLRAIGIALSTQTANESVSVYLQGLY